MGQFLFSKDEMQTLKVLPEVSDTRKYKGMLIPKELIIPHFTDGPFDIPLLSPYAGNLPDKLVHFTRLSTQKGNLCNSGISLFMDDELQNYLWNNPSYYLSRLKYAQCVMGLDFSLYVEYDFSANLWNIYRNRLLSYYYQVNGVGFIPTACFGNSNTFSYCFAGLPENSPIAINHSVIGNNPYMKQLIRLGVEELVKQKHPNPLIIYGFPLDFEVPVQVLYYESNIQRLRQLKKVS